MSAATEVVAKVQKYMDQLKREEKIGHALRRLDKIEVNVNLLRETGIGKAVKGLSDHEVHGKDAARIVAKWMEVARNNGVVHTPTSSSFLEAFVSGITAAAQKSRKRVASSVDQPTKRPKLQLNSQISPPNYFSPVINSSSHGEDKENIDSESMFKAKTERVKVFAGRRKTTELPTLTALCQKVLSKNINSIASTKKIPFDALRPVLMRCSPQQLEQIESRNPYLERETGEVWERIFKRDFPLNTTFPNESYKKGYYRHTVGTQEYLNEVTKRIKTSMSSGELSGQKKKVIAIALPLGRKRQSMGGAVYDMPKSARCPSKSPAIIAIPVRPSASGTNAIKPSVVTRLPVRPSSSGTSKKPQTKKGTLMIKAMKMYKNKRH